MLRWDRGSASPASIPPAVSWPGASFPPRGPSGRFPRLKGTIRRSESPPSLPPHFVAFVWRYPGRIRVSLPRPPDAKAVGLELVTRYLPPGSAEKMAGPPRFLGNPEVDVPCSSTPAGSRAPGHLGAATRPSVTLTTSAPAGYSRLGAQWHGPLTGCLRFAARVAPAPRKTRFRLPARLYRAGVDTPQGPNERFPRYNRFLLSQAFLAHYSGAHSSGTRIEGPFLRR